VALLFGSVLLWSRGLRESMILSLRSLRSKFPELPRRPRKESRGSRNWFGTGKTRPW
jgi:hypothetical protein